MSDFDTQVLVVGSGVAGGLVAHRLATAHIPVTILEAGPRLDRAQIVENFRKGSAKNNFMMPYPGTPHAPNPIPGENNYIIQKGAYPYDAQYIRGVGGTTWHWAAAAWRLLPNDFRLRSTYGVGRDWPISYDDVEPFYYRAEEALGVSGPDPKAQDLGSPRSKPYPMPALPLDYMDQEFLRVLNANGFHVVNEPVARNSVIYDNRPPCCGNNNCMPICPIGAQYSGNVHAEKAEAAGAKLIENAVAYHIETDKDGKSVTAVRYKRPDGSEQRVRARFFVLAANGIETPKLMLMSTSDTLSRGVGNSSDMVGRNLMDHPGTGVTFLWGKPVFPGRGPQEMTSVVNLRDGTFRRDYAAKKLHLGNTAALFVATESLLKEHLMGRDLDERIRQQVAREVSINSFHEQLPDPNNRIVPSPNERDAIGIPRPEIYYSIEDYVRVSAQHTHEAYDKIANLLGATEIRHNDQFAGNNHLMGTTIMGSNPKDSVVDADCRTHDHPNLFIASSSVFSTSATVNSTLTISALAIRLGDHLLTQVRSKT
ncbi:MAG: GMC family oxidoreductase [Acetobacteraceae bacterium]|nr:GMC family oxidoreductase [Acetobacteraceae bacterium]